MAERRQRILFWAVLLALVAGAALSYRVLLGAEPGARPPPAPAAPQPEVTLAISEASGEVTVLRGGERLRAAPGLALRADDGIETAPGARAVLQGGTYEVALEEGGRFDVQEITAELSRFRLGAGLVSAHVEDDPRRTVAIEGAPGAVARTRGGDVAVLRAGETLAVGVRRGAAELISAGQTVSVGEGQQAVAVQGRPPSPPVPLPASMLLKVSWPQVRTTNERRMVVSGRATPGSIVVLGGERVEVRPDGRFTHVIVLREGRQELSARALGVAGVAASRGPAVVLDTRAPDPRFDTRDLWVKPRH
jgi:hypothetical protein